MKNVHVIPTDKPSKIGQSIFDESLHFNPIFNYKLEKERVIPQNIYITSDEEIKEGDWAMFENENIVKADKNFIFNCDHEFDKFWRKVILTTDQDLIKDGVQPIDDTFLEWFIKNPSCEFVEVIPLRKSSGWYDEKEVWHWDFLAYKIIIQKEEPKQETLEEAAKRLFSYEYGEETYVTDKKRDAFIEGAEWQQERMYSEEEVIKLWNWLNDGYSIRKSLPTTEELIGWFEQFKKK